MLFHPPPHPFITHSRQSELDEALPLHAGHMSLYELTVHRGTQLHRDFVCDQPSRRMQHSFTATRRRAPKALALPDDALRLQMYAAAISAVCIRLLVHLICSLTSSHLI